jgi:DNA invertase Pin-like site-specific DNA recombinase
MENNMETKQTRIAIYSRVSTDGQDADNQLNQLREFAPRLGQIVFEFVDRGISGGTANRPQFQAMFQAAERKEFDILLFWSMDRLTREGTRETLNHLYRLEQAGIGFKSLTEPYLDSASIMKDVVLALLATMARQEKIRISERTKAGLATAKARGQRLGQKPVEVDLIQLSALHKQGLGVRQIAARLNVSKSTIANRLQGGLLVAA